MLLSVLILLGLVIEYYIYLLRYSNVLVIFGLFWGVGTIGVLLMYKRITYEPRILVDAKTVERTKAQLEEHRKAVRSDFKLTELSVLERGEKTPVLDVWRLDPNFQKLHPYFSRIELLEVDPASREFHLRLQLGEINSAGQPGQRRELTTFGNILKFLHVITHDQRFVSLGKFFDTLAMELYALEENEEGRDVDYPFLSLLVKKSELPKLTSIGQATLMKFQRMCDVRYENGNRITPHRGLSSEASRGAK